MKRSRLIVLTAALLGVALIPVGLFARSLGGRAPGAAEGTGAAAQAVTPAKAMSHEISADGEDLDKKGEVDKNPSMAPPASTMGPQAGIPSTPLFSDDPPGPEKTPRPKRSEWKSAPPVRFERMTHEGCKAKRIREWVEVRCSMWGEKGFSLIAGTREGIDFRMDNESGDPSITLEFPIRRGDARVFQIDGQAGKYGTAPELIISERWPEGDPAPTITLTRL